MSAAVVRSLRAFLFRAPIELAVVTSFGTMRDRPMLLVRCEDADGAVGWGEIWCNFPSVGAEHRARLVEQVFAPLLEGRPADDPATASAALAEKTDVLALQAGEPGPIAQCIAGIDIALWDMLARRRAEPLWRVLGGIDPAIAVYASGLNPGDATATALARRDEGHRAFKLKVGFGRDRDLANLAALRGALGEEARLMVDANQGWRLDEAVAMAPELSRFRLDWIEEPLRADRPWDEWRHLRADSGAILAAGENVASEAGFAAAIGGGALGVLQPDVGKWGGVSLCLVVARRALAGGLRYCPHWLGGGIGLLASAHLLAAVGGGGMLEIDANDNPLRTLTCGPVAAVTDGTVRLTEAPGLGAAPDLDRLARYAVPY